MSNELIVYDVSRARLTSKQLITYLSVHRSVSSWSMPFSGVVVAKVTSESEKFADDMAEVLGNNNVLVASLNEETTGGRMPEGFWEWLNAVNVDQNLIEAIGEGEKG